MTAEPAEPRGAQAGDAGGNPASAPNLVTSQGFLQSTLDALSSQIAILDDAGVIVTVNQAWRRFAEENGFADGRCGVGDNYIRVCTTADGASSAEAAAVATGLRALLSGQQDRFQMEYPCHSPREQRWFSLQATRFASAGRTWAVVAHENITERKLAEQSWRATDEKFRQLAENVSDVFWIRSVDMNELHYVSPAFERIWGRPVSALYAQPGQWVDFILPEDRARVLAAFGAFTAGTQPLDIEYRIMRPDSTLRWVRVRGFHVRDAAQRPIRYVGVVTDVTGHKQAEQALRENEERMRVQSTALDAAANAVVITDPRGTIQWVNAAFTRLTGYTAAEVLGQNPRLLKSGQHSESAYRQMWLTISAGRVWSGEIINRRKDGQLYHEEMTITPVCGADGAISHFIAVKQNITERKHAEASIQELHRKLLIASREAGMAEVAIDVLHNVGNVLNSVNVSASMALDRVRQSKIGHVAKVAGMLAGHAEDLPAFLAHDAAGRKLPEFLASLGSTLVAEQQAVVAELDSLRRHVEHINEIVARQQTFARTAAVVETFAVSDMVEDALRINADALTGHDIEMIRDYQAGVSVTTDRHKVTRILINVVRNARHACDQSRRSDKQITVRITGDDRHVRVAVIDNGIGLASDDLARIFHPELASRKDGHGAGLHSGATAARELGGSLTASSGGPGFGATFVLELPVVAVDRPPVQAASLP